MHSSCRMQQERHSFALYLPQYFSPGELSLVTEIQKTLMPPSSLGAARGRFVQKLAALRGSGHWSYADKTTQTSAEILPQYGKVPKSSRFSNVLTPCLAYHQRSLSMLPTISRAVGEVDQPSVACSLRAHSSEVTYTTQKSSWSSSDLVLFLTGTRSAGSEETTHS